MCCVEIDGRVRVSMAVFVKYTYFIHIYISIYICISTCIYVYVFVRYTIQGGEDA